VLSLVKNYEFEVDYMPFLNEPTFWFALISALCASYTVISTALNKRKRLRISVDWVCETDPSQLDFAFNFYNPSSEPVSVTDLLIGKEFDYYKATKYPDRLASRDSTGLTAYSSPLPINIPPHQGTSAIIPFKYLPRYLTNKDTVNLSFIVGTKKISNLYVIDQKRITPEQLVQRLDRQLRQ
jgi:hypothetical protein